MLQRVCRAVKAGVALLMAVLLQVSCVTGDSEPAPPPTMLSIYVYTPDKPVVTRADDDDDDDVVYVPATENEDKIYSLHIWIFKSNDAKGDNAEPEGYFFADAEALKEEGQGDVFQVPMNDGFSSEKPDVDIYVMANVTAGNCGITLGEDAKLGQIKAAVITGKFGLEDRQTAVPEDSLPMSGVLKGQHVVGEAPVLRIVPPDSGTDPSMSQVKLERVVSKLWFVFSAQVGYELSITDVSIDAEMLPDEEYLFLEDEKYHVGSACNESAVSLWQTTSIPENFNPVKNCIDPTIYDDKSQEAKAFGEYVDFIQSGIDEGDLSALSPVYLRESDKLISGTITYTVDGGDSKEATFTMNAAGDFSRNHIWIVYGYYDSLKLQLKSVVQSAFTPWQSGGTATQSVYNW